jgi:hypothetical protein
MPPPPDRAEPDTPAASTATFSPVPRDPIRLLREDQRQNWLRGQRIRVEDYLHWLPDLGQNADATLDLIYSEFLLREELGENPEADEYLSRFPQHAEALQRQFRLHFAAVRGGG